MKKDIKYLDNLRHSCAHLLAAAVLELWPKAKNTIGPSIENGFYYDFDFGRVKISEDDLPKIEKKMHELVQKWSSFKKNPVTKTQATKEYKDNSYKKELIDEFSEEGKKLSIYQSGAFRDLCRGGHIKSPKEELKYFKLLSVAGAYWRGDEKNKMLTRIYGTCWPTKKEFDQYLKNLKEAKERNHRILGKKFDLFTFSEIVGSGLPLYTPKGTILRRLVNEHVESIQSRKGYHQVWTPQFSKAELFKVSGHYDKYKEKMFKVQSNYSDEEFFLKPMNCPQHTQIYASKSRSYRDLPIRITDFAMLYRDEKPGELAGLARTRAFSQDDCHVFCREDQVDDEIDMMLDMIKEIMATYGFKYRYRLSTRDKDRQKNYLGDSKTWDKAEKWAEKIMKRNKIDHFDAPGEAAFYAPKMDLLATDSLGREWQLSTVQIDYFMPDRFKLVYIDKKGKKKRPVMLHRAIIGSPERFLMILIENFAGSFPVWLSPVQVAILPISKRNVGYAKKVLTKLKEEDIRAEINDKNETLPYKIRNATLEKIPYLAVIGDKEEKAGSVALRLRSGEDLGPIKLNKFIARVKEKIEKKSRTS